MTSLSPPALRAPARPRKIVHSSASMRSQIRRAVARFRAWNEIFSIRAKSSSAAVSALTVSGSTGTLRKRDLVDISQTLSQSTRIRAPHAAFRLKAEATSPKLEWLPALAGRLRAASDFRLKAEATCRFSSECPADPAEHHQIAIARR